MQRRGFTLLEVSIVLVVIALLAGSVLIGQDLIHSAQRRGQISQIEEYNIAVNTFKLQYECLPGDCEYASRYDLGADGNGNKQIEKTPPCINSESAVFWQHLLNANMLKTKLEPNPILCVLGKNSPPLAFSGKAQTLSNYPAFNSAGGFWIMNSWRRYEYTLGDLWDSYPGHSWLLAASIEDNNLNGVYLPEDAYAIDNKIDDGFPMEGKMRAGCLTDKVGLTGVIEGYYIAYCTTGNVSANACINSNPARPVYNITFPDLKPETLCTPVINAEF